MGPKKQIIILVERNMYLIKIYLRQLNAELVHITKNFVRKKNIVCLGV